MKEIAPGTQGRAAPGAMLNGALAMVMDATGIVKEPSCKPDAGKRETPLGIEPELLCDSDVGTLLGISRRSVHRLNSQGDLPSPIRLPGLRAIRWRRSDLLAWIDGGCPEGGGSEGGSA